MESERTETLVVAGANALPTADIVENILADQQDLWPVLVERLMPSVQRTLARYNVNEQLKRDAEAEAWRVLFERLQSVKRPERLRSWIAVVVSNRLMDMLRRPEYRYATAPLDETQLPSQSVEEGDSVDPDVTSALSAAVERLSPREQAVVRARLLTDEPLPLKEIERRFSIPQGSIGPTLSRSVAKLRTDPVLSRQLRRCEPERMGVLLDVAG